MSLTSTPCGNMERTLKGAAGSLYDPRSDALYLALDQLRDVLMAAGFIVARRPARESTLRVYPVKQQQYPLLNPGFWSTAASLDVRWDKEVLALRVLSKGQVFQERLEEFVSTEEYAFIPTGGDVGEYFDHGYFLVPIRFFGTSPDCEIDWVATHAPLSAIHGFLTRL